MKIANLPFRWSSNSKYDWIHWLKYNHWYSLSRYNESKKNQHILYLLVTVCLPLKLRTGPDSDCLCISVEIACTIRHNLVVNSQLPCSGYRRQAVYADGRWGVDIDDLWLASEGTQAALPVVLNGGESEGNILISKDPGRTWKKLYRPAPDKNALQPLRSQETMVEIHTENKNILRVGYCQCPCCSRPGRRIVIIAIRDEGCWGNRVRLEIWLRKFMHYH